MKLLRFRRLADGSIRLVILLDNTKTTEAGDPDEAWVYVLTWGPKPDDITATAYRDMIRHEAKLLAQLELARRQGAADEGTALSGEGAEL